MSGAGASTAQCSSAVVGSTAASRLPYVTKSTSSEARGSYCQRSLPSALSMAATVSVAVDRNTRSVPTASVVTSPDWNRSSPRGVRDSVRPCSHCRSPVARSRAASELPPPASQTFTSTTSPTAPRGWAKRADGENSHWTVPCSVAMASSGGRSSSGCSGVLPVIPSVVPIRRAWRRRISRYSCRFTKCFFMEPPKVSRSRCLARHASRQRVCPAGLAGPTYFVLSAVP